MKKIALLLIVFTFIHCSSDSSDSSNPSDSSVENNTSNQEPIAYSCEDVQEALNKVYLAYSEVEAGSLPSPGTLDSFLDWPLLFNASGRCHYYDDRSTYSHSYLYVLCIFGLLEQWSFSCQDFASWLRDLH